MNAWSDWLLGYLLTVNITAFCLMGMDKGRARKNQWRISEKTLILPALLGGALGAVMGMHTFHHKTRHWYFRYGMPMLLILQIAGGVAVWRLWNQ